MSVFGSPVSRSTGARSPNPQDPPKPVRINRVPGLVTALAIIYFVVTTSLWPTRPGLYMDESNFVNAALGGHFPHQDFVSSRVGGTPVMILPYIGVLKSALFAPVFALFGVSALSIRLPVVVLSALSLVVAYFLARRIAGRWAAAVLVVLMASCPSFAFMSKVDWGPVVLAMLLKLAAFLAFFLLLETLHVRWLWVLLGCLLLGVYNKQDFAWVVFALVVAAGTFYWQPLWDIFRRRTRAITVTVGVFAFSAALALPLVLRNLSLGSGRPGALQNPVTHLSSTWRIYENSIGYSEVVSFVTGHTVNQPAWTDWLWVPTLACLGILGLLRLQGPLPSKAKGPARAALFFLVVGLVMFVEIAATTHAVGPYHLIELWPFQDLVLLCSVTAALVSGSRAWAPITTIALSIALVGTLAAQGVATKYFVSLMQNVNGVRPVFSTDVYRDTSFLNSNAQTVDQIVSAGWGPGTPLFSLSCPKDRHKYRDDQYRHLASLTRQNAPRVLRLLWGNQKVFLVSVSHPTRAGLPSYLRSNLTLIENAYRDVFPGRQPKLVLATGAYNITYLGPGTFVPAHDHC